MFALLFDRKSGLLTLLTVGVIGTLLFAAGLVVGVNLSWDKLASRLPQTASTAPPAAPAVSSPAAPASASARAWPGMPLAQPAEPAAFSRRAPSSPPADWVPLTDGAPWPGGTGDSESATEDEAPAKTAPEVRYFVQAGTFSDEAGAEEMRTSLRPLCHGKRYQPFVESVWDRYGRRLVVVRIGPFADEAAAQEVSTGLNGSLVGRSSGRRT
jgi:cell division septation protein DedD